MADELVDAVLTMTRSLFHSGSGMVKVPPSKLPDSLAAAFLERPGKPRRLHAQIELEIARALVLSTDEMAERCLELARIALPHPPGDAVSRYLQRLGRCYIAGFFPETVIVCRAVLENAVNEKYSTMHTPWPQDANKQSPMKLRIRQAQKLGWLSKQAAERAEIVWTRGSKAAHADPLVVQNALETVRYTMSALQQLYV